MSLCAIIPVASMAAANTTLQTAGFGPRNFSVPAYGGTGVTHAALHAWDDPAFLAAIKRAFCRSSRQLRGDEV